METKKTKKIEQEKEIKILSQNGGINIYIKGFSNIETLGLLRLYEQRISLSMLQQIPEE